MAVASTGRRSRTREQVLDAALALFTADGIRGTSLEQVAERAGVHRVTLHRAFPGGRDELVAEVLTRRALDALTLYLPDPEDRRSTAEVLVEAFTAFVMLGRTDPLLHEGLCSEAAARLLTDPHRLAPLLEMATEWRRRLSATAATDDLEFPHDQDRATDFWMRIVLTLVREPGMVADEDDVRRFIADFAIPAVTRPVRPG
jgi:AcrR family transcriptional regulator